VLDAADPRFSHRCRRCGKLAPLDTWHGQRVGVGLARPFGRSHRKLST
jgi:hypothetical protein